MIYLFFIFYFFASFFLPPPPPLPAAVAAAKELLGLFLEIPTVTYLRANIFLEIFGSH